MIEDQPPPTTNDSMPIVDLVIEDLAERKRLGIERYGTPLQAHNGRDALIDLYQELLDAVAYVRQYIEERATAPATPAPTFSKQVTAMINEGATFVHYCMSPDGGHIMKITINNLHADASKGNYVQNVDAVTIEHAYKPMPSPRAVAMAVTAGIDPWPPSPYYDKAVEEMRQLAALYPQGGQQ